MDGRKWQVFDSADQDFGVLGDTSAFAEEPRQLVGDLTTGPGPFFGTSIRHADVPVVHLSIEETQPPSLSF